MYNLYIYDELMDSFETERSAYEYIKYNFSEVIEEERELNPELADATDEYIISILVNPATDGLSLIYEG